MANEGERPTSADKGKGKVDDIREPNDKNAEKGEKAPVDANKKDGESQDGTLRYRFPQESRNRARGSCESSLLMQNHNRGA